MKNFLPLLLLLSFSTFSQTANEHLQNGLNLYESKNYASALVEFTKAIELEPTYADAYIFRGNVYYSLGEFALAVSDYAKGVELGTKADFFYEYKGNANSTLGNHAQAVKDFNRAISINNTSVTLYESRAKSKHELGLYAEAIEDFDSVLILDPSHFESIKDRANSKIEAGFFKSAELDYTDLIAKNYNPYIFYSRGYTRFLQKNYSGAIDDFNIAIDSIGIFYDAVINRGDSYFALQKYEEAILDYTEAIKMKHDEVYVKRGLAKSKMKNKKGACEDWITASKKGFTEADELIKKNCK